MSLAGLALAHISYTYPGAAEPILSDVTATFAPGWTAVLGDNGIGKSTLMAIAAGALSPDAGQVTPRSAVIATCSQDVAQAPANLDDFANDWSPEALRIRDMLGVGDDWAFRFGRLSGGERKRLQIACALAQQPDVLILDEPTNHVDMPTKQAIATAMLSFTGELTAGDSNGAATDAASSALQLPQRDTNATPRRIGIVVSHDIDLVDAVARRCACFERRHVEHRNVTVVVMRPGNYTQMSQDAQVQESAAQAGLQQAKKESARLQRESAAREHDAALAATRWRANRQIDAHDHDARNAAKLAKMTSVDGSAGASKARLDARVAAAQAAVDASVVAAKRYDGELTAFAAVEPSHRTELLRLPAGLVPFNGDAFMPGEAPVDAADAASGAAALRGDASRMSAEGMPPVTVTMRHEADGVRIPELSVGPRDHIGLIGVNGAGKSTLAHEMMQRLGDSAADGGDFSSGGSASSTSGSDSAVRVLSIAQNTTDADAQLALAQLQGLDAQTRGAVLSAMAQLNADPDRISAAQASLSPGELRKLLLCLGIVRQPNLIVMDEPTNHLDLHSRQALARALATFRGAVLVVSHDMTFLKEAVTQLWVIE